MTKALPVVRLLLLILIVAAVQIIGGRPSPAAMNAEAAAQADAALNGCTGAGKELRDCVAGVLDRMADSVPQAPETQRALRAAAAGVRAAVNKAQAVTAIAACQSLITSALRRVRAIGGGSTLLDGWGRENGLGPVAQVLARMARLIQSKG